MNGITARFAAMAERVAAEEGPNGKPTAGEQFVDCVPVYTPGPEKLSRPSSARTRAIAYVSRLISDYTSMRRNPGSYKVGLTGKLEHLRAELGIMQSVGPDGETLARRWDFVVGDGRGGQYGARSIA